MLIVEFHWVFCRWFRCLNKTKNRKKQQLHRSNAPLPYVWLDDDGQSAAAVCRDGSKTRVEPQENAATKSALPFVKCCFFGVFLENQTAFENPKPLLGFLLFYYFWKGE